MTGAPVDLSLYSSQFDEVKTQTRSTLIDLNAINPLSELREDWNNASTDPTEHNLSTAADTNDTAFLETTEHGQYTAGFEAQMGSGIRIPSVPTGDSEMRWGYYEIDANGDPLNGFYFGVDSEGTFVAKVRDGVVEKVYQDSWNRDKLSHDYTLNPSDRELNLSDGQVFQIDFTYYGYGPIQMKVMMDDDDDDQYGSADMVTAHVFHPQDQTSIENTNLPIRQEIVSGGTNNDALDLYVGGRQFSLIGTGTSNSRITGHYRQALGDTTVIDDTKWRAAISFKLKDGTDIGSYDFRHVLGEILNFSANPDSTPFRWMVRRGTVPDAPTWENPTSAEDKQEETALKVDTSSADVQDGSGNLTGVSIDSGTLNSGTKNKVTVVDEDTEGEIVGDEVVTLLFRAGPGSSGVINDIYFKMEERW